MAKIRDKGLIGNLKNLPDCRFQDLLYLAFITSRKFSVGIVAHKMGICRDTLYRYVRGELPFPIDKLGDLVRATQWKGWLQYFTSGTNLEVGKKLDPQTQRYITELGLALTGYAKAKTGDTTC